MNLIVKMLQQNNARMDDFTSALEGRGQKPDMELVAGLQRSFEDQIKLINSVVSIYGIASKNKKIMKGLSNMNIMDDTTAVDLGAPEEDKVRCPMLNQLITRQNCLDLSGSAPYYDDCLGCEIGKSCRKQCTIIDKDEAFRQGLDTDDK